EAEEENSVQEPETVSFEGTRALLVEDNEINREIAQMLLSQAGFEFDTAVDGKQALDLVSASEPGFYDVVLMDIQMPVMDGYTAAKAIRALPNPALSEIPIIAMTANAFQEDIRTAEEAGMNGHIAKPLDVTTMMNTLERVLCGKQ
ncbi:MAG: response regulator, partial [Eggerthellaceae bacterium]|nr:response regulator [Eggerthellaceae bacterium]